MWLDLQKLFQITQELKCNLQVAPVFIVVNFPLKDGYEKVMPISDTPTKKIIVTYLQWYVQLQNVFIVC